MNIKMSDPCVAGGEGRIFLANRLLLTRLLASPGHLHPQYCTCVMMTSSNGNIFRVTGPLSGEFTGPGEFPTQRPVTRSFDVFFDLRLNKQLSKQPWGWWFETPLWSLWRQCNVIWISLFSTGVKSISLRRSIFLGLIKNATVHLMLSLKNA